MKWAIAIAIVTAAVAALALLFHRPKEQRVTDDWPPEIKAQVQASQALRAEVKARYPELFEDIRQCLFKHDPIGINFESNTDEYDPEVGTIIPRLPGCSTEEDVLNVVHEEFARWFGADVTGSKEKYCELSAEIWRKWKQRETQQGPEDDTTNRAR